MNRIAAWGALAAMAIGSAGAAQAPGAGERMTIELSSFKFTPALIRLRHGAPYLLHFTNTGGGAHNFVAKAFFAAAQITAENAKQIHNGEIDLDGGDAVDLAIVAPSSPGRFEVHCSHFMHQSFGMKATIEVY